MISIKAGTHQTIVPEAGIRLDQFLAQQFPDHTRSFLKKLILLERVYHNDVVTKKPSTPIVEGDTVSIDSLDRPKRSISVDGYENFLKKRILHTHEHFFVINKPAGIIVHPSSESTESVTISDIVTAHYPEIACVGQEGRPGIVHRLDGDTSGIMLIARTPHGYEQLTKKFKERTIKKTYHAVVKGHPEQTGSCTNNIIRHPSDPRRMTCRTLEGRESRTDYHVIEYFDTLTLLEVSPYTGRTHQIRVHLSHNGFPIIGDEIYGVKDRRIKRQALHAYQLDFEFDGKQFNFTCPIPGDFKRLIELT